MQTHVVVRLEPLENAPPESHLANFAEIGKQLMDDRNGGFTLVPTEGVTVGSWQWVVCQPVMRPSANPSRLGAGAKAAAVRAALAQASRSRPPSR
jgi:hypothetical protein